MRILKNILLPILMVCFGCAAKNQPEITASSNSSQEAAPELTQKLPIEVGASRINEYLPLIKDKGIGLVVNQTSTIGNTHLVDSLLALNVNIKGIFAPEHGFRGTADAGEKVEDGKDSKTGIPVISIYGKTKKPSKDMLAGIDLIIFDIQDVGARFYTYISSMHYVMEACAEQDVDFMVLDRPNPNGHYVDGPILNPDFRSFVGMHPIPVVHGMTIGEYAQMVNGEGWLKNGIQCSLKVILCKNYDHQTFYELPIKPSPNLPDMRSIYLYPSTCFFEGTVASEGRGTPTPFQVFGHPKYKGSSNYTFIPVSMPGAKYPKLEGQVCRGRNLSTISIDSLQRMGRINLSYLIDFYHNFPDKPQFFKANGFFNLLAGNDQLVEAIKAGDTEEAIRATWQEGLDAFKQKRTQYLLYP